MTDILVDRRHDDGNDFTSSNIDVLGYDRETETLYVEFHSSPTVYAYSGVKESTYDMLIGADSVGSFYAHHIKGNFDSEIAGEGVIQEREDDPIQPERKWLSVPEGETPDFAQGGTVLGEDEQDVIRISGEGIFGGSISIPVIKPTRYAVEYTVEHDDTSARYKPEFTALSEADAISQFNEALSGLTTVLGWTDVKVKIVSVTHYLD